MQLHMQSQLLCMSERMKEHMGLMSGGTGSMMRDPMGSGTYAQ
jgi:hypothetical protein